MAKIEDKEAATKPSLAVLSTVLRNKALWPKKFEWSFYSCDHCAMGLACSLWESIDEPFLYNIHKQMDIPYNIARSLFVDGKWVRDNLGVLITPEMVADQIDKYLETHKT